MKPILAALGDEGENEFCKFFIMKELDNQEMFSNEGGACTKSQNAAIAVNCAFSGAVMGIASFGLGLGFGIGCSYLAAEYCVGRTTVK